MCVCVVEPGRGTGLRVEVELRVEGWRMYELESEYEITRRRYASSLHELHDKYMSYSNT